MRRVRGDDITIVFQEPMTSLNPLHTIEKQIGEILLLHRGMTGAAARARTLEVLTQVGIPDPETRLASYPHQLSGGQRQRVMIAMALANEPDLLIADEPTTALDVTVQAQIIDLLQELQKRLGMSLLFITHDLGIVRKIAQRVCVMKEGKIVEQGDVEGVFAAPAASLHASAARRRTEARSCAAATASPGRVGDDRPEGLVSDQARRAAQSRRSHQGGRRRQHRDPQRRDPWRRRRIRLGQDHSRAARSLRLISSDGPIVFMGNEMQGLRFKEMRPFRHDMQIVFQDPYGSLSPRLSVADIIKEGLNVHQPGMTERSARSASPGA